MTRIGLVLFSLVFYACSECPLGSEGCPCTAEGGCDDDLSCLSDTCIDSSGSGGGGGDGGSGGTGGTGATGGTGGTGATGGTGGTGGIPTPGPLVFDYPYDYDSDGVLDAVDNCPQTASPDQTDTDHDDVGDPCDVCPLDANPLQENLDGDEYGDLCDLDRDGDTILDATDNCPDAPNLAQLNTDGEEDGGDACDLDDDDDTVADDVDDCRLCAPGEPSCDCEDDPDGDGIDTRFDNCPTIANPQLDTFGDQLDEDGDGLGDLCDPDADDDGVPNHVDNCPLVDNPDQIDNDRDGLGDGTGWGVADGSCDPVECYVTTAEAGSCTNPTQAFAIEIAPFPVGADRGVGETIGVPVFTNRPGETHQIEVSFTSVPTGSAATLAHAAETTTTWRGTTLVAFCLSGGEPPCADTTIPRFVPDQPGAYEIHATALLPDGDPLGLGAATASATFIVAVPE